MFTAASFLVTKNWKHRDTLPRGTGQANRGPKERTQWKGDKGTQLGGKKE